VVVENFSTGVMERLGLGHEALCAANPQLVFCSVSAYGREGPFADRMGFDPVVQAESGFVSMNGYPDRQGVRAVGRGDGHGHRDDGQQRGAGGAVARARTRAMASSSRWACTTPAC
jgi:hypothetical protein